MSARVAVLAYLAGTLHDLALAAAVPETDAADGYAFAITQALTTAGLAADAAAIPDTRFTSVTLLADYYGLLRLQRAAAPRVTQTARLPGEDAVTTDHAGDVFDHISSMLIAARTAAQSVGLLTSGYTPTLRSTLPTRGDLCQPGSEYRRAPWEGGW